MRIFLLHLSGRKASVLQKRLGMENIPSEHFPFEGVDETSLMELISRKLMEVNACICYIESPNRIPPKGIINAMAGRRHTPLLVLDEKENEKTKEIMKKNGVELYIPAPFSYPDIAMKLKFMVYKNKILNGEKILRFCDLELDFINHTVKRKKRGVNLRNREFSLLEFFLLNCRRVLTRNTILEHVWDRNDSLLSNTVDVHVGRLRKRIDGQSKRKLIHTVHGVGYKLDIKP